MSNLVDETTPIIDYTIYQAGDEPANGRYIKSVQCKSFSKG